ncbi:hypothetical protein LSH36_317g02004 [Paralvinella palmiformis]|uniref:Fas-binding factor 1 C-terminal domain-containing protein n=1 Tax=Paralvinella palmiformis TaxID=53620 RepID=A0AAD9JGP2_9ANNE|nr:hypothetical protein LSH36_317g02004 [Paralvinella palmiformis]
MSRKKSKDPPIKPAIKCVHHFSIKDDDFYSSLAASAAENEVSDVSEADPAEIAKSLEKTPLNKPKTVTDNKESEGISSGKPPPKKSILDDLDDPLEGLLSDEEDEKPKPKRSLKKALSDKQDSIEYDSDKSQGSRRLEVDRPPTRSGKKPEADCKNGDDDHRPGGAKSILDELLGGSTASKHLEKPGSGERRENLFERKLASAGGRLSTKENSKETEDDFVFGTYTPSAATGSRPSSRRSVRFEESDDLFGDKPTSRGSSAGKRRAASSHLEMMIANDDRDWLELASNAPPGHSDKASKEKRPSSEGAIADKPSAELNGSAVSEPVDWLGLARLGSPDITPRTPEDGKGIKHEVAEKSMDEPLSTKPISPKDKDEEELPFPRASRLKTPPGDVTRNEIKESASSKADDWLTGSEQKTSLGDDYLGLGDDINPDDIFRVTLPQGHKDGNELFTTPQQHMSASLPWSAERPRIRRQHSDDKPRSSSAERISRPQGTTTMVEHPVTPMDPGSAFLTQKDEDDGNLFTSPNLFDDTPILNKSIHRLEMEKTHLQLILETMKGQHLEEVKVIEESYKKRMDMLEDMWQKRENRLREENDLLSSESLHRLKKLEEEKAEMMTNQLRQLELWEQDKYSEIRKLKDIHSKTLDELRAEYQKALETVRKCKDQELEAAINAGDHARHLQAVISRVEDHASNLDDLQQKVSGQHVAHLDQRETSLRNKDQQLKVMQERLERQQHENEQEHAKLQGLEKWRVRQEEGKLQSGQKALEKERELLLEQVEREKLEVGRSKTQLIEEQKTVLSRLAEERQALAEERAQFSIKQRFRVDEELNDSVKVKRKAAQVRDEGQAALVAAQKKERELNGKDESLNKQLKILRERERQIAEERLSLAKEKHEFEKQQGAMLCVNCRTPVRDANIDMQGGYPYRMTQTAQNLFASLTPDIQNQVQNDMTTSISATIEMDKLVRLWRRTAQKDKDFLTEEKMYLRALKSSPYHEDQNDSGS